MSIELDLEETKIGAGGAYAFHISDHIDQREDKETILKTKAYDISAIATAISNAQALSLEGRAVSIDSLEGQLQAMDPEMLRVIDKELGEIQSNRSEDVPSEEVESTAPLEEQMNEIVELLDDLKTTPPGPNYWIKIQTVVGKMLAMHIRLAEKERVQKDEQKAKFNKSNKEWGNFQREIGDRGFNFTWIALGVMALQFVAPESDKQFVAYIAKEGCQNIANMLNSDTQSKQQMVRAASELAMAEINAMMNKGSSDSSSKQEQISLLDKTGDAFRRAAQST